MFDEDFNMRVIWTKAHTTLEEQAKMAFENCQDARANQKTLKMPWSTKKKVYAAFRNVKTTLQKTRFRSVNLYKEFAYRSKNEYMVTATTIKH